MALVYRTGPMIDISTRFPPEILVEIFRLAIPPLSDWAPELPLAMCGSCRSMASSPPLPFKIARLRDLFIMTISCVCRHWRTVAISAPFFWTKIDLRYPGLVDLFMERSGHLSLHINIQFDVAPLFPDYRYAGPHYRDRVVGEKVTTPPTTRYHGVFPAPASDRTRSLRIRCQSINRLLPMRLGIIFPLKAITTLAITSQDFSELNSLLSESPYLEHLHLTFDGHAYDSDTISHWDTNFSYLQTIVVRTLDYSFCKAVFPCIRGSARPTVRLELLAADGPELLRDALALVESTSAPAGPSSPQCHQWMISEARALHIALDDFGVIIRLYTSTELSTSDYQLGSSYNQNAHADFTVVLAFEGRDLVEIHDQFEGILRCLHLAIPLHQITGLFCWARNPVIPFDITGMWYQMLPKFSSLQSITVDETDTFADTFLLKSHSLFEALVPSARRLVCPDLQRIAFRAACEHEWDDMWETPVDDKERELQKEQWNELWDARGTRGQFTFLWPVDKKLEPAPMHSSDDIAQCLTARRKYLMPLKELEIWCDDARVDRLYEAHRRMLASSRCADKFIFTTQGYKRRRSRILPITAYFPPMNSG